MLISIIIPTRIFKKEYCENLGDFDLNMKFIYEDLGLIY